MKALLKIEMIGEKQAFLMLESLRNIKYIEEGKAIIGAFLGLFTGEVSYSGAFASASTIKTPGMTGFPGKCPAKYGSLLVTFLYPTALIPGSKCVILSMSKNG